MSLIRKIYQQFTSRKEFPLILVTGAPKTGTTAVYHSIREQLPANSTCLFEPENRDLEIPETLSAHVLVKSFVPYSIKYDHFTKKILITRDPRDNALSRLLYSPYNIKLTQILGSQERTNAYITDFLKLLEHKEKNPKDIGFRELYEMFQSVITREYSDAVIRYYEERPSLFILKYEDYVDGKLNLLSEFLGLKISIADDVPQKRVIRSKSYGNWKNWFTRDDIGFFREKFQHYMSVFGYEDDWEINENPEIDPQVSSLYVRKLIEEADKDFDSLSKKKYAKLSSDEG